MAESQELACPTREWQPERFADGQFIRAVPAIKWAFFAGRVRPIAEESAPGLWKALFAGVGRPFHYKLAEGWMGQVFRQMRSQPSDLGAGRAVAEVPAATLGWVGEATAFLAYSSREVYAAGWAELLDCYGRGWLPLTDVVVCSEATRRVALFWEGFGLA